MNVIVFGLDIDDCLALEYYLKPHSTGHFEIYFRGEVYNRIKTVISAYHHNTAFFVGSYSARQSFDLDCINSKMNGNVFSAHLLDALVRQLADETKKSIFLDMSTIEDPKGECFKELLDLDAQEFQRWDQTFTNNPHFANTKHLLNVAKTYLELLSNSEYSKFSKTRMESSLLKLVRARQLIGSVMYKMKSSKMKIFLFDDRPEYLNCIGSMLLTPNADVKIQTFLVDPYFKHPVDGFEYKLNKSRITRIDEIDSSKNPHRIIAGMDSWDPASCQYGFSEKTHVLYSPGHPATIFPSEIKEYLDSVNRNSGRVVHTPNMTSLEGQANQGFYWGNTEKGFPGFY